MEIPAFEKDEFSFLNNPDALWMPYVRKFLSNQNVVLMHMGVILSTTNSARQVYHSDGIPLDKDEHKPYYAINVFFILLVLMRTIVALSFTLVVINVGSKIRSKVW